jgi:GTP-binding protein HflX
VAQLDEHPDAIPVSALKGRGMMALLDRIEEELERSMVPLVVDIPYQRGDLVDLYHKRGLVDQETYDGTGTHIEGRVPANLLSYFASFA